MFYFFDSDWLYIRKGRFPLLLHTFQRAERRTLHSEQMASQKVRKKHVYCAEASRIFTVTVIHYSSVAERL